MKIRIQDGLAYVTLNVTYQRKRLRLERVLLDTGSAGTLLATDKVLEIGVQLEPHDTIHRIRGVGGAEFVFMKCFEMVACDEIVLENFEVEVGAMQYGLDLDGILGLDFLLQVGATIDLAQLEIYAQ